MPIRAIVLVGGIGFVPACMALSPQLPPTDVAALQQARDLSERQASYEENRIRLHHPPQGTRYSKGSDPRAPQMGWRSLDVVLRSDAVSSSVLPTRPLRAARVFTALTIAAGLVSVAGIAASARTGLDLARLDGPGAILLVGGLSTVAFGVAAGAFHGRARRGYESAAQVYNDSLATRLGLAAPH